MKIDTIMRRRQTLSLEIFPPKAEADADLSGIKSTIAALRCASPDFISVTYGAGGGNKGRAVEIAGAIVDNGMTPLSHLTAVGSTREMIASVLEELKSAGVENVLALRGDVPVGVDRDDPSLWRDFKSGRDIAEAVAGKGFCIGGAAYPEGHQESVLPETDIRFMRDKEAAGVSFFVSQLFFDTEKFFNFVELAERGGVSSRIVAGVMPVLSAKSIKRIITISGCSVPKRLDSLLERYSDDEASMRDVGMDYAAGMIAELWEAGFGVHIYAMNKAPETIEIMKRSGFLSERELLR